jgi:hypothetical protein
MDGVSIVTGPLSNGIMAIDFDGLSALRKYLELSSNQLPPPTKRWDFGKNWTLSNFDVRTAGEVGRIEADKNRIGE